MKLLKHLLITTFLFVAANIVSAQNNADARALVKNGIKLNEEKNYAGAIEKYNAALKLDSGYLFADYQLAFSLYSSGKAKDAIPHLEKVIKGNTSLNGAAYDLLGLVYFHEKQYAEAEQNAIEAIKLDPKHAGTMRMYALVCFHQNKRAAALLGFCSFIMQEPHSARGAEAYGNIQHILEGGALKPEPGEMVSHAIEANIYALNQAITQGVADAAKTKHATATDQLGAQLKNIFTAVGQLAEKQTGNDFFRNYLAAYFYKLAQSPNMPAFARLISAGTPESAKWIANNTQKMADLDNWLKNTERGF